MKDGLENLFGRGVKRARERQGLTQAQLAIAARKSVETISNIERGVTVPSLHTLVVIAGALDCFVGEILGPTDLPIPLRRSLSEAKLRLLSVSDLKLLEGFVDLLIKRRTEEI